LGGLQHHAAAGVDRGGHADHHAVNLASFGLCQLDPAQHEVAEAHADALGSQFGRALDGRAQHLEILVHHADARVGAAHVHAQKHLAHDYLLKCSFAIAW
jgi:hypothetical protein